MPLLFSVLEHYNLLSKQPNCTCGLFFWLDVYDPVLSQSNHEHFQKGLDFSREALLLYFIFPKINRTVSKTVRQKDERDIPGPQDNLEGKSCPAGYVTLSRPGHVLAAPDRWRRSRGANFSFKINRSWACDVYLGDYS